MTFTPNEHYAKLMALLKSGKLDISQRSADTDEYKKFIAVFPATSVASLSMDQYCLGNGKNNSFCWWIERGLEPVLGRYSPGSSKGHILYYMPDGSIYKHQRLEHFSDKDALEYTLKIQSAIINADPSKDLSWIDEDAEIYQRAGVKPIVTIGGGRKLRLLSCYHPDQILPISSSDHLAHFLTLFGLPKTELPISRKFAARLQLLNELYKYAKEVLPSLSTFAFMKALYSNDFGHSPPPKETAQDDDKIDNEQEIKETAPAMTNHIALNTILFGPPGTGKTYATIDESLMILDPDFYQEHVDDRPLLKLKFDAFVNDGLVRFITFHQSFSYEDFVEGLRADTDDKGALRYEIVDGIFKTVCDSAAVKVTQQTDAPIDLTGRRIWKMSLGDSQNGEAYIYDECIKQGYALHAFGNGTDFTACKDADSVRQLIASSGAELGKSDYGVTAINIFKNKVKIGDLIVVTDGNLKFRAIGEVTGEYKFLNREVQGDTYAQCRAVKWLRVYAPSVPIEQLMNNRFSQMTIYELRPGSIDIHKLTGLLSSNASISTNKGASQSTSARVLIIDEINRGNISRIFGELITLIEPSKRAGASEALSVTLPYSKKPFSVPSNVHIIGTMNTTDRSLAGLDIALRRRFTFKEMPSKPELLDGIDVEGINIGQLMRTMNERIEVLLDRDHCLGHAYFMPLKVKDEAFKSSSENQCMTIADLKPIFSQQILPLLQEYFFEDWERIAWVLNDQNKPEEFRFIQQTKGNLATLFGAQVADTLQMAEKRWHINKSAFDESNSYKGIIKVTT